MARYIHHRIRMLLEETSTVFTSGSTNTTDYAEFATLALPEFKHALRKPGLTSRQLKDMLREGSLRHKASGDHTSWAAFLASHIENIANGNAH